MEKIYNVNSKQIDVLGKLLLEGFTSAYYSHDSFFNSVLQSKIPISLAYLSHAHTCFINARTYVSLNRFSQKEQLEFEVLIDSFFKYYEELMENARSAYSHKWKNIEFYEFVKSFKKVSSLLSIEVDKNWLNLFLKEDQD